MNAWFSFLISLVADIVGRNRLQDKSEKYVGIMIFQTHFSDSFFFALYHIYTIPCTYSIVLVPRDHPWLNYYTYLCCEKVKSDKCVRTLNLQTNFSDSDRDQVTLSSGANPVERQCTRRARLSYPEEEAVTYMRIVPCCLFAAAPLNHSLLHWGRTLGQKTEPAATSKDGNAWDRS